MNKFVNIRNQIPMGDILSCPHLFVILIVIVGIPVLCYVLGFRSDIAIFTRFTVGKTEQQYTIDLSLSSL